MPTDTAHAATNFMTSPHSSGTGKGTQTADGCSVDFYRLLQPHGEPKIIASALKSGASILELGCGVGRITHPLLEQGFRVVAVDNSAEMLAHVQGASTICAEIEQLRLKQRFDAVLLMSHFINTPDEATRRALLATCRYHLSTDGVVIIQRHDPAWLRDVQLGLLSLVDGIESRVDSVARTDNLVEMTMRWVVNDDAWTQTFTTEALSEQEIEDSLAQAGLRLTNWLDDRRTWLTAKRAA